MNKYYLLFFIFFVLNALWGQNPQQLFVEANQAFLAKSYGQATAAYESILKKEQNSKEVYYNLGTAYLAQDKVGKAILNYEKALRIDPKDKDIRHNLAIATTRIQDNIETVHLFFIMAWWQSLSGFLSSGTWAILGLLGQWIAFAGLALWLLHHERERKKQGFSVGLTAFFIAILFFTLAITQAKIENNEQLAVITTPETAFKTSPDDAGTTVALLHEGIKINIIDQIGSYWKVTLPNGEQGWLLKNGVEKI